MSDDSVYNLTAVGKLLQRRAKKTKLFWLSCIPTGRRLRKAASTPAVCDGHTQTTPTIQKTFFDDQTVTGSRDVLQMPEDACVVGSSRDLLDSDSDVYMGSYDSLVHSDDLGVGSGANSRMAKFGNCPCVERAGDGEVCKWSLHEDAVMNKLVDLQQEVNALRATLSTLQHGGQETTRLAESSPAAPTLPPPPPPPPPPPFPSSPVFLHSVSLSSLSHRPKTHLDDMPAAQDRGKPIITLEDLQKVKLRQVSSVANVNFS
ncbi:hypothetical protein ONE63_010750 [Megalurothrips usitatus]|uniref:Uncharacterized protein n=1 Tax=Megalurothrips usitatus TaxID=439358 RepID=A0AAV7XEZ9_9NEOP|nr:hypothetical protein ONE63_010750 [Megalurothrips usitatus]